MSFRLALFLAAASGFVALSYEIVWYRLFSFVTEGAPVAFGALLGAYLIGIAIGSYLSRVYCEERGDGSEGRLLSTQRALGRFLFLANAVAFLVAPGMGRVVTTLPWFAALFIVVIATMLLGAVLPLTSHLAIAPDDHAGARLSYLYLANILGSSAGSLLTGFVAMDHASTREIAVGLALLGFLLAAVVLVITEPRPSVRYASLAAVVLASVLVTTTSHAAFDDLYERLLFRKKFEPGVRFAATVENRSGIINVTDQGMVYGGGAYDGAFNTDLVNDKNWIARAYAVGVLHPHPKKMLMIGLSSGSWAKVLAALPGLEHFTIVEINPGYLSLIEAHPEVSGILHDPKVEIVIDDGRRWLESHPGESFDAVVMNMTWHWRAHATNLLSREFMALVKRHLVPGGLFYFNTTSSMDACATALEAFPYTARVRNFIAGSDAPLGIDPVAWRTFLEGYRIDGRPVLDLGTDEGRDTLDIVMTYAAAGDINADLEVGPSLRKTCSTGEVVTDDNMLTEWRKLSH